MPTADSRLQYPNHAFNSCKVVVHRTKTAPVRGAYNRSLPSSEFRGQS